MARKNTQENGTVLIEPDEVDKYTAERVERAGDVDSYSEQSAGHEDDSQDEAVQGDSDTGSEIAGDEPEEAPTWHSASGTESVPQISETGSENDEPTLCDRDFNLHSVNSDQNDETPARAEGSGAARGSESELVSENSDTASELSASSAEGPMDLGSGTLPEPVSENGDTGSEVAAARRRRRSQTVFSIDGQRSVQTEADRRRSDLIDMAESMKSGKILTGIVQGIERPEDNPNLSYAVLYHGTIKVVIPAQALIDMPPEEWEEQSYAYRASMIVKRLGAEIDYVVKGVDPDNGIAAGSRVEAMVMRRREYLTATDRSGMYLLNEGAIAEMRVVSVIRAGIFVDCFGLEVFIPLNELNYQRWVDAQEHFSPGDRVLTRIMDLNRSDRRDIKVRLSVKQAGEDSFTRAVSRYKTDNNYVGMVSVITQTGIFVNLDGVDCLCRFPKRGRPAVGARVTVKLLGIDILTKRIWGVILR